MNEVIVDLLLLAVAAEGARRIWFGLRRGLRARNIERADAQVGETGSIVGRSAVLLGLGYVLVGTMLLGFALWGLLN